MDKIERVDSWLKSIPDNIIELKKMLDKSISDKLDGSLGSLDILEKYLINRYGTDSSHLDMPDKLAGYVGDVAQRYIKGAVWDINTKYKKDIYYNSPVLKVKGNSFNPFTIITASLDRKRGTYIRNFIEIWM